MRQMWRLVSVCLLVLAGLVSVPFAQPATVLADDATIGTCSEAAFNDALAAVLDSGGGTLVIGCSEPITFTSQKTITSDVTIVGDGAILDGGNSAQLFRVNSGARLALIGLTVRNGNSADNIGGAIDNRGTLEITASTFSGNSAVVGGAIYNSTGGTLTITASTFSGNSASSGGAINNVSTLEITASTFSGNSAASAGGAIYNPDGTLTITTSTFSGNRADNIGGAIFNTFGTLTITASTFSGNRADNIGGAIFNTFGTLTVGASILTNSPSGGNCSGAITSAGYNLSDDTSCNLTNTGDQQGGDVTITLGALQDNGGPTQTMLPEDDSDAIGAIPAADCLDVSTSPGQRGVSRPQDDCESGAVELGQVPVQIITTYNLGPIVEGGTVAITIIAFGPANTALTYQFDCDNDGAFELSQQDEPSASCTFSEAGSHPVPVQVSDGTTSATDQTIVEVLAAVPTIVALALDPSPWDEGEEVELTASFTNPSSNATHTCMIAWGDGTVEDGTVEEQEGSGSCQGSHTYTDDAEYTVSVEVCDNDQDCDEVSTTHPVTNLPPVIDEITVSDVGTPGEPVTLTVDASDPAGANDPLTYAFDCAGDGSYEVGPQSEHSTSCPTDDDSLTVEIGVRVSDDDGGMTEKTVTVSLRSQSYCADSYTGQLRLGSNGCSPRETPVVLTAESQATFCAPVHTGQLRYGPSGCSAGDQQYDVPGPEPLPTCVNIYTGAMRVMLDQEACGPRETSHLIPAG